MTRLLVSVRDANEALDALAGGADLIDIKEPNAGSLGAASADTVRQVVVAIAGRRPVSVALGELSDADLTDVSHLAGVDYAKVGLAGERHDSRWARRWRALVGRLPPSVRPVAVVYADYERADAPTPEEIVEQAKQVPCAAVLIDTYDKSLGKLTEQWSPAELLRLAGQVRDSKMLLVVAGSLAAEDVAGVGVSMPDFIAVRSAVCESHRTARLSRDLVERFAKLVNRQSQAVSSATDSAE